MEDEDAVVRGAAHECGRLDVGRAHRQFGCGQQVGEQGQRGTGQRADKEYRIWRSAGNDDKESVEFMSQDLSVDEEKARAQKWCIDSGTLHDFAPSRTIKV